MGRTSSSRNYPQITRCKSRHPEKGKFGAMQTDREALGTAFNCFGLQSNLKRKQLNMLKLYKHSDGDIV